ncbi:MAG: ATP synthase F0 subunit B, partial [Planctomycetota bacterium]
MSRKGKQVLKLLGVLYFIAFVAFLLTFSRLGFHWYTRPRLIPTQFEIPRREGYASDEAFAEAKAGIVKAGYRLRGPNAGLKSGTFVGDQELAVLIEKSGPPTVPVQDPRLVRQMASRNLVAGEEFRHEGAIICRYGVALDEKALTALALAYDDLEGEARHDRIMVKGSGSIVGFDLTMVFAGLNFLVLVAFLYAVLWEPVTRLLDERAQAI